MSDANLPLTMECTIGSKKVNQEPDGQQQADIVDYKFDSPEVEDDQQVECDRMLGLPTLDSDPLAPGQSNSLSAHLILILSMILVMQAILSHI